MADITRFQDQIIAFKEIIVMSGGVKGFLNKWMITIVMVPSIIGLHWSWVMIQNNDKLVPEYQRKELPIFIVSKNINENEIHRKISNLIYLLQFHFSFSKSWWGPTRMPKDRSSDKMSWYNLCRQLSKIILLIILYRIILK